MQKFVFCFIFPGNIYIYMSRGIFPGVYFQGGLFHSSMTARQSFPIW